MVLSVGDEYVTGGVDGDALQPLELGVVLAPPTERAQECPVRIEDLNPVVARIWSNIFILDELENLSQ